MFVYSIFMRSHPILPPSVFRLGTTIGPFCPKRMYPMRPSSMPASIARATTWQGPRGVAGHSEAHACAWPCTNLCPLGSLTPANRHDLPKHSSHVGTVRGPLGTMPAGPDRTTARETWPPDPPEFSKILESSKDVQP
jgi:hypothetical protein